MELESYIRDIPDFPKPGIIFKDITTLLKDGKAFRLAVDRMLETYGNQKIDQILGIESRGFIFAGAMALEMGCGLLLARKPGKLPAETISEEYALEYGTNTLELHRDAIEPGQQVVIVDDLLATGGTARAAINLVERLSGKIAGIEFLIELDFLEGRKLLSGYPVHSQMHF